MKTQKSIAIGITLLCLGLLAVGLYHLSRPRVHYSSDDPPPSLLLQGEEE